MNNKQRHHHQLPPEIVEIILSYASTSLAQLLEFSLTCRAYNTLIDQYCLWKYPLRHQFATTYIQICTDGYYITRNRFYTLHEFLSDTQLVKDLCQILSHEQQTLKRRERAKRIYSVSDPHSLTICVTGPNNVGKSSFVNRFVYGVFCDPAIASSVSRMNSIRYSIRTETYYACPSLKMAFKLSISEQLSRVNVYMVMYSITSYYSFTCVENFVLHIRDQLVPDPEHTLIMVVGNRLDMSQVERSVPEEDVNNLIDSLRADGLKNIYGMEISCKENVNIEETIDLIVTKYHQVNTIEKRGCLTS